MDTEELKKKILSIARGAMLEADELPFVETTEYVADALIADGIGDVAEWKRRVNDYKQRAEVAEKERNECERKTEIAQKAGKIIQRDMLRVFGSENPVINDKINALWDLALQQAEREIEENALRQALLTVEEERKDENN